MNQLLENLQNLLSEKSEEINEVNLTARLAADNLIGNFTDEYDMWIKEFGGKLFKEDLHLAIDMVKHSMIKVVSKFRKR